MNKTNILFYPTLNGDYLRMQVRHNGEKVGFNVGFRIDRSKWSAETQRCKKNTTHYGVVAVEINARIEEYEAVIYNIIKNSPQATKNEIRTAFNVAIGKERSKDTNSLAFLVDKFIGETNDLRSWSANTYKKWKTIGERIKRLGNQTNKKYKYEKTKNQCLVYLHNRKISIISKAKKKETFKTLTVVGFSFFFSTTFCSISEVFSVFADILLVEFFCSLI